MAKAGQGSSELPTRPLLVAGVVLAAPGIVLWSLLLIEFLFPSAPAASSSASLSTRGIGFQLAAAGAVIILSVASAIWLTRSNRGQRAASSDALATRRLQNLQQICVGVAHDINGELSVINGGLEIVQRHTQHEHLLQQVRIGRQSVRNAHRKLEHTLAFSSSTGPQSKSIELRALCKSVGDQISHAKSEALSIACNIPDGIWSVRADPDQLEAALFNIASHAARIVSRGGSLAMSAVNLPEALAAKWISDPPAQFVLIRYSSPAADIHAPDTSISSANGSNGQSYKPPSDDALVIAKAFADENGAYLFVQSSTDRDVVVDLILPRSSDD